MGGAGILHGIIDPRMNDNFGSLVSQRVTAMLSETKEAYGLILPPLSLF